MEQIKKKMISVPQLIVLMIINRLVISITFGSLSIGGNNIWDCIISSLIVFFLIFLFVSPMYLLFNQNNRLDISDLSKKIFGNFGHLITIIYSIYFMLICAYTLSSFKIFIENVMDPPISFFVLSTSLIIFSCYAASKGIEAIARSASLILFFTSIFLIFIGVSLFKIIDFTNFKPFFFDGYQSVTNGTLFMISRMSCIPAMGMLIPMSNGNIKKGIIVWNLSILFLMSSLIFLVTGVLGELSEIKLFPIYTSTSVAKVSKFENLDALFLGLWTSGIFIKLSMFINLSSECLRKVFGKNNNKIVIFLLGIFLIFTNMFAKITNLSSGIFDVKFLFTFTILVSFIIPLVLLICKKIVKREIS